MAFPDNSIRTATLNTGHEIPFIGLGTWQASSSEVETAVTAALRSGYRHIDTAAAYGNESAVGAAIRASEVPRGEIFLTTKLANEDHQRVADALEESLEKLGTDYVDLYLVHWPCPVDPKDSSKVLDGWDYVKTWTEMQKLVETGKVRSIGVSNFGKAQLERLLGEESCKITPAVNQIEIHPAYPSRKLVAYNTLKGIHTTAYSCLGSKDSPLFDNATLVSIAKGKGKSVQQVLLRWGLHRGWSVIPKSVTPERIAANFDLDGWGLTFSEVKALESIQERFKVCDGSFLPNGVKVFEDDE